MSVSCIDFVVTVSRGPIRLGIQFSGLQKSLNEMTILIDIYNFVMLSQSVSVILNFFTNFSSYVSLFQDNACCNAAILIQVGIQIVK